MDYTKELSAILENDPLGLLDVKPKSSGVLTADARLIASFHEINDFVRSQGHEPTESRDIQERRLYSRLKGIRDNPTKAEALLSHDEFNLLAVSKLADIKSIKSVDDILGSDALGLLDDEIAEADEAESIFTLTHVKAAPKMPDYIAKRKLCKEFAQFETMFKAIHADLSTRKKVTKPFNSEKQINRGDFFILQGMIVYVANKGMEELRNFGNYNTRLYCVFENGTESNLFLRSLAAAFWKDPNSRQIVDGNQYELFQQDSLIVAEDVPTGYIYVLKSLSKNPQITQMQDLYKIGFSSNKVEQRTRGAKEDPTYLFNDVRPIVEFKIYNVPPQKFELLLHKFFAEACLDVDVYGRDGKRFSPREWFVVPIHVIGQAVRYIENGEIVQFIYDPARKEIVRREKVD